MERQDVCARARDLSLMLMLLLLLWRLLLIGRDDRRSSSSRWCRVYNSGCSSNTHNDRFGDYRSRWCRGFGVEGLEHTRPRDRGAGFDLLHELDVARWLERYSELAHLASKVGGAREA